MEGVVHPFGVHAGYEQAVGLNHHLWVGGLHADHQVVVVVVAANTQEFHGAFYHAFRRVAVAAHDAVRQRTVVGSDAHGPTESLAFQHQRRESLADAFEFLCVRCIGVLDVFESFFVGVVAGVDADLLDVVRSDFGGVGRKVDVGDKGHIVPFFMQGRRDGLQGFRFLFGRRRDPNQLASRVDHAFAFGHRFFDVHRIGSRHRLNAQGGISTKGQASNLYLTGGTALVVEPINATQVRGRFGCVFLTHVFSALLK